MDNATPSDRRQPSGVGLKTTLAMAGLALLVFAAPTFVVVAVGMLPTVVALIVDRGPRKYASRCVGGLNLSGVAPYLVILWETNNSLHGALSIVADVYAWLVMYSAAALGWLLYLGLPPLVGAFLQIQADHRIAALRAYQAALTEEWGAGVAGRTEGG